jgi:hypothetical protein
MAIAVIALIASGLYQFSGYASVEEPRARVIVFHPSN